MASGKSSDFSTMGFMARYFEEGRLLGHGINLNQGLQLTFSCALSLFVCLGIARPRTYIEAVGAALFYALLLVMVPTRLGYPLFQRILGGTFNISVEFYKFIIFGVFLLLS